MIKHIGTQVIETERLILRKFEITDAKEMFNNWAGDPENCEHLTWSAHKNVEETKKIIADWAKNYENKNYYNWVIILKNTNELVGGIDAGRFDEHNERANVGYLIAKRHWGKGIMTEALTAIIDFLFNKVNFTRIEAYHHVGNPASGRVMEKCGMKYEGTLEKYEKTNRGEFVDTLFYAILKETWGKVDMH